MNWPNVDPSFMSAVASIGAAIAAFLSLRVSREAKLFAEQSALAAHHGSAAIALTSAVDELINSTRTFYELSYDIWADWPSEIEKQDHRKAGGSNPRPLRHVLSNASEMLVNHGIGQRKRYKHAKQSMFSIVLNGVNNLNEAEFEGLLKKADGKYPDFEATFGTPSPKKNIATAPAFRWSCYQLNKRVEKKCWYEIWGKAWQGDGWLTRFRSEHSKIRPTLEAIIKSLNAERGKLNHTVFPLESNPSLCLKYDDFLGIVETLLEDCSLEFIDEAYSKHPHEEDVIQLIVYSMGIAFLAMQALNNIHGNLTR
jgi:hypothetical protein